MNVLTLLNTLEGLGVSVTVRPGGKLRLEPASLVPADLLHEIRAAKPALLKVLRGAPTRPDPLEVGQQQGHCGSCARWSAPPQAHMGLCSAGKRAHGWLDGNPTLPVELQAGHGCMANGGKGWQAIQRMQTPPVYRR